STIWRWTSAGYLFPELRGVYAVGHPGRCEESDLFSAVLYAGPGAALAGVTGGLWRGLVKWRTAPAIEVATPRRCRSLPADHPDNRLGIPIAVHGGREFRRSTWRGVPTTPIPNTVLEIARTGDLQLVRFVLAQCDYLRILNERKLRQLCGRGVPGSAVLLDALGRPQPLFAHTRSWFEVRLIMVCEITRMRLPDALNVKIAGHTVDAVWWDEQVVVECDGEANHGTWRQRRRDVGEEMTLRGLKFLPIRYTTDKLDDPWAIYADLGAELEARRGRGGLPLAG
ncbi:MAG TPA: hypothetical protein VGX45_11470, partial [Solirubrobacteraceae bacterium]|nr:hypothetical protein [Solirubrobacteraceae bacterium]